MDSENLINRWWVVFGAILIQLCLGAIYAWSVFTPALLAEGWSKLDTQIVFAVGLATFAFVMVFAGRKLPDWGPQKLAISGGITLGLGYILAGLGGGTNFWIVCIGIGFLGGAGIGLGYVVPIAVGMRWFPDHKGMITGLAVAGFGFGAMGWVKLAGTWGELISSVGIGFLGGAGIGLGYVVPIAVGMRWFPDHKGMITGLAVAGFGFGAMGWVKLAGTWGELISSVGIAQTFIIYGISFSVLVLLGSIWMKMPPKGWLPEGFEMPKHKAGSGGEDFLPIEMMYTPQFYLIFLTFAVSAGAGLMSIGLMKLYPMEALQNSGYSAIEASAIAGTAMAVFFSIANGIGRIVWGILSDKLGRKLSIIYMAGSQGLILLAFTSMAGNEYLLYLGATLIGFNFGGNFALFPALTADEFGNGKVGQNYPFVFLSYGVGGIIFPLLGGLLGDMNNFSLAFSICGIACLIGAFATAIIFPPHHNEAIRHFSVHGFLHQAHLFDHQDEKT